MLIFFFITASSIHSRSIRGDSFHHRVPSIRRTSTSTIGSRKSNNSLDSSYHEYPSLSPTIDGSPPIRISPCPERKLSRNLPPPSPIMRMKSLPHSSKSLQVRSLNVRRLSSTPTREQEQSSNVASRRSSLSFNPGSVSPLVKRSNTATSRSGRISSSSLRLPSTHSPNLDLRRGKALSQSFRASSSTTKVTVHKRDSSVERRGSIRRPKSTREIQKDLESIINNEFKGNLRLDTNGYDLKHEEKISLTRRKSLRSTACSPNLGVENAFTDLSPLQRNHITRRSFHGSRRGVTNINKSEQTESRNFLELPSITKTNWDQQDSPGPIRSRSLHGRPTDYKKDHPKIQFSEY